MLFIWGSRDVAKVPIEKKRRRTFPYGTSCCEGPRRLLGLEVVCYCIIMAVLIFVGGDEYMHTLLNIGQFRNPIESSWPQGTRFVPWFA